MGYTPPSQIVFFFPGILQSQRSMSTEPEIKIKSPLMQFFRKQKCSDHWRLTSQEGRGVVDSYRLAVLVALLRSRTGGPFAIIYVPEH
jgi:hypothetical protein